MSGSERDFAAPLAAWLFAAACMSCGSAQTPEPPPGVVAEVDAGNEPSVPSLGEDPACELFTWPLTAETAEAILVRTEFFTNEAVGDSGSTPPQVAALNVLLDQPDAVARFERVAREGRPAGRIFALCAFQVLDDAHRVALANKLRKDTARIRTQFGCVGGGDAVSELADVVERGRWGKRFREARNEIYAEMDRSGLFCGRRSSRRPE